MQFFSHPEGTVSPKDVNDYSQGFDYVYDYVDHLGNVRLSYTDANGNGSIDPSNEIVAENNYYPFGLAHKGYNNNVSPLGNSKAKNWKYADEEFEEDLGKNTVAYQWRDYDPAIGRFNKVDRFAENYSDLTPYHFTANNPIYFREVAGDSLIVYGDETALSKFAKTIDNGLGGLYKTNISEDGLLTLKSTGKKGELTEQQQSFFDTLSEATDLEKSVIDIDIVESSEDVIVGNFGIAAIDIDDVNAFGDGPVVSSYAKIGHEVAEQTEKQRNGKGYNLSHQGAAINAENAISGSTRIDVNGVAPTSNATANSRGVISGTVDIRYRKNKKIKTVTYHITNGNITKVDQ